MSDAIHPFAEQVGPFYSTVGACHLRGLTEAGVAAARDGWEILGMETSDGVWVYPAFQFDTRGRVKPWLADVLLALRGTDRWSAGLWLTEPNPDLAGRSPLEAGDDARVQQLAAAYGAAVANR